MRNNIRPLTAKKTILKASNKLRMNSLKMINQVKPLNKSVNQLTLKCHRAATSHQALNKFFNQHRSANLSFAQLNQLDMFLIIGS